MVVQMGTKLKMRAEMAKPPPPPLVPQKAPKKTGPRCFGFAERPLFNNPAPSRPPKGALKDRH